MPLNIIVTAKQVIDPEAPVSALRIDQARKQVITATSIPPVVNGFDENAVEAALRIKDAQEAKVTVVALGASFVMDVIKKPLSMGADELVLLQDEAFEDVPDSYRTAQILAAAIRKLGEYDLVLCGRQASDWDNAQVPQGLAELLGLPCITIARDVKVQDGKVVVERVTPDGIEVMEASLPTLVTVSNELGQPRYPTLRGIMAATRKQPTVWKAQDLGLDPAQLQPLVTSLEIFVPPREKQCEFIEGEDDEEKGRQLALKLREAKLI
ncbi:MAG: electron transfer flavoprotein subunit beta/FixA family protein [Dehalococcoidia bacterium]